MKAEAGSKPIEQGGEMARLSYKEQLAHPFWQRRRLERLEAAGWKCADCSAAEQQLHVHHERYISGRMVWDYPDDLLTVLCDACHGKRHGKTALIADALKGLVKRVIPEGGAQRQIDRAPGFGRRVETPVDGKSISAADQVRAREAMEQRKWLQSIDLDQIKGDGLNSNANSVRVLLARAEQERKEIRDHFGRPEL